MCASSRRRSSPPSMTVGPNAAGAIGQRLVLAAKHAPEGCHLSDAPSLRFRRRFRRRRAELADLCISHAWIIQPFGTTVPSALVGLAPSPAFGPRLLKLPFVVTLGCDLQRAEAAAREPGLHFLGGPPSHFRASRYPNDTASPPRKKRNQDGHFTQRLERAWPDTRQAATREVRHDYLLCEIRTGSGRRLCRVFSRP